MDALHYVSYLKEKKKNVRTSGFQQSPQLIITERGKYKKIKI